jgi:hypothetical protein
MTARRWLSHLPLFFPGSGDPWVQSPLVQRMRLIANVRMHLRPLVVRMAMMADLPYSRVCDALQNGSRQTLRVGVRGRGGPDASLSLERALQSVT